MEAKDFFKKYNSVVASTLTPAMAFGGSSGVVSVQEAHNSFDFGNDFADDTYEDDFIEDEFIEDDFIEDDLAVNDSSLVQDSDNIEQHVCVGVSSIVIEEKLSLDDTLLSDAIKTISPKGPEFLVEEWNCRFTKCETQSEVLHDYALMRYAVNFENDIDLANISMRTLQRLSPAPCSVTSTLLSEISELNEEIPTYDYMIFRQYLAETELIGMLTSEQYNRNEALNALEDRVLTDYALRCLSNGVIETTVFNEQTKCLIQNCISKGYSVDEFELSLFKSTELLNSYLTKIASGQNPTKPFWLTQADLPDWFITKYIENDTLSELCDSYQEYAVLLDVTQFGIRGRACWSSKDVELLTEQFHTGKISLTDYKLYLFIYSFKNGYNFHFDLQVPTFNMYCMSQLAEKLNCDIACPSFIGHTIAVLRDNGKMNIYDCEKMFISGIDTSGVSHPEIQILNDYSGILVCNGDNTDTISKIKQFSYGIKGSLRSWAASDIVCASAERYHLMNLIAEFESAGEKVSDSLYEYTRNPYESYQQADKSFSYACEFFTELKYLFLSPNVAQYVRCILPFTHVRQKQQFLFKFLKLTFGSVATFNVGIKDFANCDINTIEIILNDKQVSMSLTMFFKSIDELKRGMLEFKNSYFDVKNNKIFVKIC